MRMIQFNKMPTRMVEHNAVTFGRMVATLLQHSGRATYSALAAAATGHEHGDKSCTEPEQFVDYCLRRGWLAEQETE
jgi:hypothetical protein